MVLYTMKCDNCKQSWELSVPMSERNNQICGCGGKLNVEPTPTAITVKNGESPNRVGGSK